MGSAWGSAASGQPAAGTAGWLADPWGRFAERWHEDGQWTSRVRTGAVGTEDPFPAGQNHSPLPEAIQSEPTKTRSSKAISKRAVLAVAAVLGVVAVGLVLALVVVPGSGTSSAKSGRQGKDASSRKSTTTTIDVGAIRDRANVAVNKACDAQSEAGYMTNSSEGYDTEFQKASVSPEAYSALLNGCIGKKVQESIDAATVVNVYSVESDPETADGQSFMMAVKVTQMDAATGFCTFRAVWDSSPHTYSFEYAGDNAVFASGNGTNVCPVLAGLDQDDVAALWVEGRGSITYDTQMGGSLTVPSFQVLKALVVVKN